MSMLSAVRERTGWIGDRMLARLAPKRVADAACGDWVYCCGYDSANQYVLGQWRRDVEHNGICTPCYSLDVLC